MKLSTLNLLGVVVLIGLCVGQWRHDRVLNLEVGRLQQTGFDQGEKLSEQQKRSAESAADLVELKAHLSRTVAELQGANQKLRENEQSLLRLTGDREQLKASVTNWAGAVARRDARIEEDAETIRRLGEQLNERTRKYNELAIKYNALTTNYNGVVKELNDLRSHPQTNGVSP